MCLCKFLLAKKNVHVCKFPRDNFKETHLGLVKVIYECLECRYLLFLDVCFFFQMFFLHGFDIKKLIFLFLKALYIIITNSGCKFLCYNLLFKIVFHFKKYKI